jgi:hypothetical protein
MTMKPAERVSLDPRVARVANRLRDIQLMLSWLDLAAMLGWLLSSLLVLSLAPLSRSP